MATPEPGLGVLVKNLLRKSAQNCLEGKAAKNCFRCSWPHQSGSKCQTVSLLLKPKLQDMRRSLRSLSLFLKPEPQDMRRSLKSSCSL